MEFGKISKVELRDIWKKEATDFTPWLAENLDKLSELIGIDLEIETKEAPVGNYSLDILAKDVGRDRTVIIENQLERTDHTHLGQLITYASYYKADVIVWISQAIQEEHRSAIDWLNNNTNEKLEFFAVEIEIIKIDDSKPALNLKLKAYPNEWQKSMKGAQVEETEKNVAYREFYQKLIDNLRDDHKFTNARKGQPQSWYNFSSGTTGLTYAVSFAKGNRVRVELYIDTGDAETNKNIFAKLKDDKVNIEQQINEKLEWEELPNKRASRIAVYRDGNISDDSQTIEEINKWCIDKLLQMKNIFGSRIPDLLNLKNSF